MKNEDIRKILQAKLQSITNLSEKIDGSFQEEAIFQFKKELKLIRSFMSFVRTHKGEWGMRMPDKIKKLYNIAGALYEEFEERETNIKKKNDEQAWADLKERARDEWNRYYSKTHFIKFEKQLVEYKYGGIPVELLDNFFSRQLKSLDNNTQNVEVNQGEED